MRSVLRKRQLKAAKGKAKRQQKRKGTTDGEERQAKVARRSEVKAEEKVASAWAAPEAPMIHKRIA